MASALYFVPWVLDESSVKFFIIDNIAQKIQFLQLVFSSIEEASSVRIFASVAFFIKSSKKFHSIVGRRAKWGKRGN